MTDHNWLIPGQTRVRHIDMPDAVGLLVSLDGGVANVQFDGDSFLFPCHPNDLKPE